MRNGVETFMAAVRGIQGIPLFTYRSPLRRRGLLLVGVGAVFMFASIPFLTLSVIGSAPEAGSVLAAMCGPLLVAVTGAALFVLGGDRPLRLLVRAHELGRR